LFPQNKRIDEVSIFGDDDALFEYRSCIYCAITRMISLWKITSMNDIMTSETQPMCEATWKMGINEEIHAAIA
jgi:hypothetical protein